MINFKKNTVVVMTLIIIITIGSLASILYYTNYIKRGESAIIFLIGDPQMEFDDLKYTTEQIRELEEQYGTYWNNLDRELGELWGYNFDLYYVTTWAVIVGLKPMMTPMIFTIYFFVRMMQMLGILT